MQSGQTGRFGDQAARLDLPWLGAQEKGGTPMGYLAVCSFDLEHAGPEDYEKAYAALATLGLNRKLVTALGNEIALPTTTTAGEFSGNSVSALRNYLTDAIRMAFLEQGFRAEIFVFVSGEWAWGQRST